MGIATIEQLMQLCVESGASDIHLSVGSQPMLRMNTHLIKVEGTDVLGQNDVESYMRTICAKLKCSIEVGKTIRGPYWLLRKRSRK